MKSIKELSNEFRGVGGGRVCYGETGVYIADKVDAWAAENMPPWVKITKDESTWPVGESLIAARQMGGAWDYNIRDTLFEYEPYMSQVDVYQRPLTEYDRPEQEP